MQLLDMSTLWRSVGVLQTEFGTNRGSTSGPAELFMEAQDSELLQMQTVRLRYTLQVQAKAALERRRGKCGEF